MKEKCLKYDNIGDILEYGNITDQEAIILCNNIIDESILESDNQILEAMYHAILTGIVNRRIGDKLRTDVIIANINKFSEEVLDYIITILAYTGNKAYEETIRQIGQIYDGLNIDDSLAELSSRMLSGTLSESSEIKLN